MRATSVVAGSAADVAQRAVAPEPALAVQEVPARSWPRGVAVLAVGRSWWDIPPVRYVLLIAALVLIAASPAAAAASSSSQAAYLAAQGPIQRSGFWGSPAGISDAAIIDIGQTACSFYARGMSDAQVLAQMVPWAGELAASDRHAYDVGLQGVRDAHRYICPQY